MAFSTTLVEILQMAIEFLYNSSRILTTRIFSSLTKITCPNRPRKKTKNSDGISVRILKNSDRNSIGKATEFLVFFLGRFGHVIFVRDENFWWPRGWTVQRGHFAWLYYQDHEGNNFPPNSADMEKKVHWMLLEQV